jgi:hypothetical protein
LKQILLITPSTRRELHTITTILIYGLCIPISILPIMFFQSTKSRFTKLDAPTKALKRI